MTETPTARDLFAQIWFLEMSACDGEYPFRPGDQVWRSNQTANHAHWARVWLDCVELAQALARAATLAEQAQALAAP